MERNFEIQSIDGLRTSFNQLEASSKKIDELLTRLRGAYARLDEGYSSTNSQKIQEAMDSCAKRAQKISENVETIKTQMDNCIKQIEQTDETTTE